MKKKNLIKKMCDLIFALICIGLMLEYIDKINNPHVWFKSIFCLALIPPAYLELQFGLLENQKNFAKLDDFIVKGCFLEGTISVR